MAFDQLLKEAGEFGLFQKALICGFVAVAMTLMATAYWTQVYILLTPPHRCKLGYNDTTWSPSESTNFSISSSSECHLNSSYAVQYRNNSEGSTCPFGFVYDYSDLYPTFPSEHDWVCDNSWRVYTSHTCYWIGGVAGFLLFGSLSDRIGRKYSFIYCVAVMMLADIGTFFTSNFTTFLIARFFSAIGEANLGTCCFVLAIEYTGPKYRVWCLAVWSFSYTVAATIMPWIVFALNDWHYILSFAWAVSAVSIIYTLFIPESASWLMTRGRTEDAAKCIHRVAKVNGKRLSLYRIKEMLLDKQQNLPSTDKIRANSDGTKHSENKKKVDSDGSKNNETKTKTCNNGVNNNENKTRTNTDDVKNNENRMRTSSEGARSVESAEFEKMSFCQAAVGLIRTPNMRKKTFLLTTLWMIAAMCYVGNSLETSNLPWSFRLSYSVGGIAELPANLICPFILDRIGRRWSNVMFFTVGGALGIIAGAFLKDPTAVLVLVSIMRMCNAASYDITFTFSSELFPTVVRGRGVTIIRTFGGFASAISPFIFSLSERDKLLPLAVFGILCVVAGALTLFLPEPAGQYLPHTLEEGENFGKNQPFFYCPFSQNRRNTVVSNGFDNLALDCEKNVPSINSVKHIVELRNSFSEGKNHS